MVPHSAVTVRLISRLRRGFWSCYASVWDAAADPRAWGELVLDAFDTEPRQQRILDAGCGTGNHTGALARAGFDVVGVDSAAGMRLRAAAKTADLPNASILAGDLDAPLPFSDRSFDGVICGSVLQCVVDPTATLAEFARILRPAGRLLIVSSAAPGALRGRSPLVMIKALAERTRLVHRPSTDSLRALATGAGFTALDVRRRGNAIVLLGTCPA